MSKVSSKPAMFKMLSIALFSILGLAYFKYYQISQAIANSENFGPPPAAVTTIVAAEEEWQPSFSFVASIEASQGAVLKSQARGKVTEINFSSGSEVKKGELLVKLDTSVEHAQLLAAEAKATLAQSSFKRASLLKASNAMAEANLDEAAASLKQANAEVEALRSTISRMTLSAPFDGRTGIRMVNVGEYLQEGDSIVPLYAEQDLFLNFSIPQSYLREVKVGQDVRFFIEGLTDSEFLAKITAIDPQVDEITRNVRAQATVSNTDLSNKAIKLRPGMFARANVQVGAPTKFITLPSTSIYQAPYGDSVYVVEMQKSDKGKEFLGVTQHFVKVGNRRGDQVAVIQGLNVGREVVTSGLFRLRPGAPVQVNNSLAPSNLAAPSPTDT